MVESMSGGVVAHSHAPHPADPMPSDGVEQELLADAALAAAAVVRPVTTPPFKKVRLEREVRSLEGTGGLDLESVMVG